MEIYSVLVLGRFLEYTYVLDFQAKMIDTYVKDSHILHRAMAHQPLNVVAGSGINLILEDGQEILDASAGPAVSCLGHSNDEVTAAVVTQLNKVAYVYSGSRYRNAACEDLASHLLADRPGGLSKAIFVNSGSEATDAALKLAAQYWHEIGQPQRNKVVSRSQSYHGNTIGALCVSGHESRRELYSAWMSNNVSFVDPCYAYRGKKDVETDAQYVERLKTQLEDMFLELDPNTVAAFIAEPVSGTTLGCVTAVPGYFRAVREVCDKYDVLLILDEVSCLCGSRDTWLMLIDRLCAVWARQEQCTPGNKRVFEDLTYRLLARLSGVVSYLCQEYCFMTRSSKPWLMARVV